MNEKWMPIKGFEHIYSVSDQGRVRSEARVCASSRGGSRLVVERFIKSFPCRSAHGYLQVGLCKDGGQKTFLVHLLVIRAFKGNGGPEQECAHLDGDRENAKLSNLSWKSHVHNEADKSIHGTRLTGERCPWAKIDEASARAIKADTRRQVDIAAEHGISQAVVSRIKSGVRWSHL